jgi:hypothetical protein
VKCVEAPHIKSESSKAVTPGFKRSQLAGCHRFLHNPTPNCSVIPPKVDCFGSEPDDKVSDAVMCKVFQM